MIRRIIISLFVCLGNFWIWFIFSRNAWIGVSLVVETILFNLITLRFNKKLFIPFVAIYLLLVIYLLKTGFDSDIWRKTPTETLTLSQRYEYLATDLGKIYKNRFLIFYHENIFSPLYKIQSNLFPNLDINLYFFASHPREREKVHEYEKYPFILWPFFLFGVYLSFKKVSKIFFYYLLISLLVSAFIKQNIIFGPILFFPLINVVLINATVYLINLIPKR